MNDVNESPLYPQVLDRACRMMQEIPGLEPTSALKQCASDAGIPEGERLAAFCLWAYAALQFERPDRPMLSLACGSKSFPVADLGEASKRYQRFRGNKRSSTTPEGKVFAGDVLVARVSYNGRVWNPEPWNPGDRCLLDPVR